MKKLLLISFFTLATFSVSAEDGNYGFRIGLNTAREVDGGNSTKSRTGLYLGLFYDKPISANWSLQPELAYSQQGGRTTFTEGTVTEKFDYMNCALIFKAYILGSAFSIDFGPQAGYLVSAKASSQGESIDVSELISNKSDVSIVYGMSYKFGTAQKFDICFRMMIGLIKYDPDISDLRNKVSLISMGIDSNRIATPAPNE